MQTLALPCLYAATLVWLCLSLTGCTTPPATQPPRVIGTPQVLGWWKPYALYLQSSTHSRLQVEIDSVQGCEPDDRTLERLSTFLSTYCQKPGGIDILRSDVIPIEAARRLSEQALARKYMNGPSSANSSTAFMYILFYDDTLCARPGGPNEAPTSPYTDVLNYPAIYFNTRYLPGNGKTEALLHEAGHMLGLASRLGNAPNRHCPNETCLMNTYQRTRYQILGLQKKLCPDCAAELEKNSAPTAPGNLRYIGPVLVRSESNYHVLTLPGRCTVVAGPLHEHDCDEFRTAMQRQTSAREDEPRLYCRVKDDVLWDATKLTNTVAQLETDPFPPVRNGAPTIFLRTCASRYDALLRFTNELDTLRYAISINRTDAWSYNRLAWLQATCPDASVRNSQEAISAANRACELTRWLSWTFIDTLAAAYAEAGDFERAIEFENKALHTGLIGPAEQNPMEDRLFLYKQSIPFRQVPRPR